MDSKIAHAEESDVRQAKENDALAQPPTKRPRHDEHEFNAAVEAGSPEDNEAAAPVAIEAPAPVAIEAPAPVAIEAPAPVAGEAPAPVAIEAPAPVAIEAPVGQVNGEDELLWERRARMLTLVRSLSELIKEWRGEEVYAVENITGFQELEQASTLMELERAAYAVKQSNFLIVVACYFDHASDRVSRKSDYQKQLRQAIQDQLEEANVIIEELVGSLKVAIKIEPGFEYEWE